MSRLPLTPEVVIRAYASGIFPMAGDDGQINWYSPNPRCIIDLDNFHVPKRLARTYRQGLFELKVDCNWPQVLMACAARQTTWISQQIYDVYTQLYMLGLAHSVEAYLDNRLVGGLYGVSIGGAFMGESMFHHVTDASKVCLVYLVERLKRHGYILLDCQFMTGHLSTFGALNISQDEYLLQLGKALSLDCTFA